jgi:hypothetical protein
MLSVAHGASWRGMFFDWIGRKEYFNKFLGIAFRSSGKPRAPISYLASRCLSWNRLVGKWDVLVSPASLQKKRAFPEWVG